MYYKAKKNVGTHSYKTIIIIDNYTTSNIFSDSYLTMKSNSVFTIQFISIPIAVYVTNCYIN